MHSRIVISTAAAIESSHSNNSKPLHSWLALSCPAWSYVNCIKWRPGRSTSQPASTLSNMLITLQQAVWVCVCALSACNALARFIFVGICCEPGSSWEAWLRPCLALSRFCKVSCPVRPTLTCLTCPTSCYTRLLALSAFCLINYTFQLCRKQWQWHSLSPSHTRTQTHRQHYPFPLWDGLIAVAYFLGAAVETFAPQAPPETEFACDCDKCLSNLLIGKLRPHEIQVWSRIPSSFTFSYSR